MYLKIILHNWWGHYKCMELDCALFTIQILDENHLQKHIQPFCNTLHRFRIPHPYTYMHVLVSYTCFVITYAWLKAYIRFYLSIPFRRCVFNVMLAGHKLMMFWGFKPVMNLKLNKTNKIFRYETTNVRKKMCGTFSKSYSRKGYWWLVHV